MAYHTPLDRVAQAHRAVEMRAGQEEAAIGHVHEQLRHIQRSKANHDELMSLVSKLQYRPKPGQPLGVTQLLTVPYPLPPSQPMSSTPRSKEYAKQHTPSRPGSAGGARPEYREVPTCFTDGVLGAGSRTTHLATSEQILVRDLPADAEPATVDGRATGGSPYRSGRAPPSSHTSSLSARANAAGSGPFAARRPASARAASAKEGA